MRFESLSNCLLRNDPTLTRHAINVALYRSRCEYVIGRSVANSSSDPIGIVPIRRSVTHPSAFFPRLEIGVSQQTAHGEYEE